MLVPGLLAIFAHVWPYLSQRASLSDSGICVMCEGWGGEDNPTGRRQAKRYTAPLLFHSRYLPNYFRYALFFHPFFYKTPTCFRVLFNKYNKKNESVTDEEGVTLARTRSRIRSIQKRLLLIQLLIKGRGWDWSGVGGRLELLYSISPTDRPADSQSLFLSDKPHRN